ncbi:hypothetical protein BJX76DRAFT_356399 [Aspergillus varians]
MSDQEHQYKFNVSMSCGGCSGAVERVLKKLDGVKSFDVSLDSQTASVVTDATVPYEMVLATIKKTGKTGNTVAMAYSDYDGMDK